AGADLCRADLSGTPAADHFVGPAADAGVHRRVRIQAVTSPAAQPVDVDVVASFESMASVVNLRLRDAAGVADHLVDRVRRVFAEVEAQCTRFDPTSPLMRANAAGEAWCPVPVRCYQAIREAAHAYRITSGRFDPRVLRALQAMGY